MCWQVGAGCWLEASVVFHVSLSMDCSSVLIRGLAFPGASMVEAAVSLLFRLRWLFTAA